jgi:PAS domain S-box-containing protein
LTEVARKGRTQGSKQLLEGTLRTRGAASKKRRTKNDIGDRKQAEDELRRSEAYLAEGQRLTHTGSWAWNVSTRQLFWSLELFRIFDIDPASTKASLSAFLERVHPEDRLAVEQRVATAFREGNDFEHEYRLLLSDGSTKYIHSVGHPVADETGKIIEFVGAAVDITDRNRAESELRRSEAYLAEAQKLTHTGCWARNTTSGELFWSQEEWRIFGLDPTKTTLSYKMFLQMVHPEDRPFLEETSKRAVRERKPYDIPFRIVLPDGSVKHIHSVGNPVLEESGDVVEYIGVSMDVTERKRGEAALQEAQAELARVARLTTIGELAASIAHEINQPLTAVVANGNASLRWLAYDTPNLDEAREAVNRIIRDANRASDVIARIRALLKNDKPEYVALDINDAIREVLTLTSSALQMRGVSVRTELSAGLPPVLGDRVQLQQVIMNLIMNGADAMSPVTNRPRVLRIRSHIDGSGSMLVGIEDSGTGLDAGIVDRIFDPLFTTKPNGMGMGLSICRSIVEAHGGRIWMSPGSSDGAVFQFTVPAAAAHSKCVNNGIAAH